MSTSLSLKAILKKHEEQLIDESQNICILCKRKLANEVQLERHRKLSELHSTRLNRLRKRLFTDEQIEKIERKEREALYRDRAKERRQKIGEADRLVKIENPYSSFDRQSGPSTSGIHGRSGAESLADSSKSSLAETPLGKDNKGAALLSKMGWKEGFGLGKSNQGMVNTIQLKAQVGTSGLGAKKYKVDPNTSYQEAVRQVMLQRYQELSEEEKNE